MSVEPNSGLGVLDISESTPDFVNDVTVTYDAGSATYSVVDPGSIAAGAGCVAGDVANEVECAGPFDLVQVDLGGGADVLDIQSSGVPANVLGGAGDDDIALDPANDLDDSVFGGEGDDVIDGGAGADSLDGDSPFFSGTDDFDTVAYHHCTDTVTIDLALFLSPTGCDLDGAGDTLFNFDAYIGGDGDDVMTASFDEVVFDGGEGDDALTGGSGDDTLLESAGEDTYSGGEGIDTVDYSRRAATGVTVDIDAAPAAEGAGDDGGTNEHDDVQADVEELVGTDQDDTLTGAQAVENEFGTGDDTLYGLGGDDTLNGRSGADVLIGGLDADAIDGGTGGALQFAEEADLVSYDDHDADVTVDLASTADDQGSSEDGPAGTRDSVLNVEDVEGGTGDDVLTGTSPPSEFQPGGDNTLVGGPGDDELHGEGGSDTLWGDEGGDVLDGGAGFDQISYADAEDAVTVTVGAGADDGILDEGDDVRDGVEIVHGSDFGDDMVGPQTPAPEDGGFPSQLDGGGGDDTLTGGPRADSLNGGDDDDEIAGGAGNDTLEGGPGVDDIEGGVGDDEVDGGPDADTLDGGADTDLLDYSSSQVEVEVTLGDAGSAANDGGEDDGAEGDRDVLADGSFENVRGSAFDDDLVGSDGANHLDGGPSTFEDNEEHNGNDRLDGGGGNDTLDGGSDSDDLVGGAGTRDVVSYGNRHEAPGVNASIDADVGDDGSSFDGPDGSRDTIHTDVEDLVGTAHADTLTGGDDANVLVGGSGADTLNGNGGSDILEDLDGSPGDVANAGAGTDEIVLSDSADGDTANCDSPADQASLDGGDTSNGCTPDTTAPAPTISDPAPNATLTDTTPTFSGTAGNRRSDQRSLNISISTANPSDPGVHDAVLVADDGTWSYTVPADEPLANGSHEIAIQQSDRTNNTSAPVERQFTVDVPSVTLNVSPSGSAVNTTTPHFSGTSANGTTILKVYSGTAATGSPVVEESIAHPSAAAYAHGLTLAQVLTNGTTYTAQAEQDFGGSTGIVKSVTRTFRVDTTAPTVDFTTVTQDAPTDDTPVFSGTKSHAVGDLQSVSFDVYAGTAIEDGEIPISGVFGSGFDSENDGTWSGQLSESLAPGQYVVRASVNDDANNFAHDDHVVTVSDGAPPTVSLSALTFASPTNDRSPAFSGNGGNAPGDSNTVVVKVFAGATATGTPVTENQATRSGTAWTLAGVSPDLADGQYTARAFQSDDSGLTGESETRTFTVDGTAPATPVVQAPTAGQTVFDTTPTVSGTAGNATGDNGSVTVRIYAGSAATGTPVSQFSATRSGTTFSGTGTDVLAAGTHTVRVEHRDSAQNSTLSNPVTFTVDPEPPGLSITTPAANATVNAQPTISGNAGDLAGDSETISIAIHPGATANAASVQTTVQRTGTSWTYTPGALASGPYVVVVEQVRPGGDPLHAERAFTVDADAPAVPTITGGPPEGSESNLSSFTLGALAAGAHYECRFATTGDWSINPCSSPVTIPAGEGARTFQVRAVDQVGNASDAVTRQWTRDTVAPTLTLTPASLPANPSKERTPTIAWTVGADADQVVCKLDNETSSPCEDGSLTLPSLSDGSHTFTVRAVDEAGNPTVRTHTWTVDATAPTPSITGGPGEGSTSNLPSFTLGAPGGDFARYECRFATSGSFTTCISPVTIPAGEGDRTFQVRAVDTLGNESAALTRSWKRDTVAPSIAFGGTLPDDFDPDTGHTFSWSKSDATSLTVTAQCKVDDGAYGACNGAGGDSHVLSGLAQGAHSFSVKAVDAAGNESDPRNAFWTVDSIDPVAKIARVVQTPDGDNADVRVDMTTTDADPQTRLECRLDAQAPITDCGTSRTFQDVAPGDHTVEVVAIDRAGNESAPDETEFEVSEEPHPTSSGDVDPGGTFVPTGSTTPSADDPVQMALQLPSGTGGAVSVTSVTVGPQVGYGLLGEAFDISAPAAPAGQKLRFEFYLHRIAIEAAGLDEATIGGIDVFRDGAALPDCSADPACVQSRTRLPEGGGAWTGAKVVVLTQAASVWSFGADSVDPTTTLNEGGPAGETEATDAAFSFSSNDEGTFQCSLDGGAFAACTSPKGYSGLSVGPHTFAVRAVDEAGNVDQTPATRAWTVKAKAQAANDDKTGGGGGGGGGTTPTPPAGGPRPTTPARGLAVSLLKSPVPKLAAALRSGVTMAWQCSSTCRVSATLSIPGSVARKLKLAKSAKKPVVVARGTGTGSGRVQLKLRFTAKAKKALRRQRSVKLSLGGTATGALTVPLVGSLTLKR